MIVKEAGGPGRWSVTSLEQSDGKIFIRPDPFAGAQLEGWAVVSAAYDLFVADVNGDGKVDLIAKERAPPGKWYVALGDGASFQPQPQPWLTGWALASAAYDLFVVDVNGDGKADLVAKERGDPGNWYVALSDGSSFKPRPQPWLTGWALAKRRL